LGLNAEKENKEKINRTKGPTSAMDKLVWRQRRNQLALQTGKKIDYSEGSMDSHIKDLLDKKFIESLNPNKIDPPYKITEEGKSFLNPILFTTKIGVITTIWVTIWGVIYLLIFNNPVLVMGSWFSLLLVSFIILSLVLAFFPHILVRVGKRSY
jgi:hypothetical protein